MFCFASLSLVGFLSLSTLGNPTPSDKREQSQLIPHGLDSQCCADSVFVGLLKAKKNLLDVHGENILSAPK